MPPPPLNLWSLRPMLGQKNLIPLFSSSPLLFSQCHLCVYWLLILEHSVLIIFVFSTVFNQAQSLVRLKNVCLIEPDLLMFSEFLPVMLERWSSSKSLMILNGREVLEIYLEFVAQCPSKKDRENFCSGRRSRWLTFEGPMFCLIFPQCELKVACNMNKAAQFWSKVPIRHIWVRMTHFTLQGFEVRCVCTNGRGNFLLDLYSLWQWSSHFCPQKKEP